MVNKIIDGIINAIYNTFGDDYEIHVENIEQGFNEPCFFIFLINSTNRQFFNRNYITENQFVIEYFPISKEKNKECNEVSNCLFECLEYITIEGHLFRGLNMNSEIVDNVLNFTVNYNVSLETPPSEVDLMKSHKVKSYIRKDEKNCN